MVKLNMRSFLWGVLIVIVLCNAYLGEGKKLDPTPTPWPKQFHSILFINNSGSLQVTDLWYDWSKGRNFNIIQKQLGRKLYDLEWDNGTSFYYYLDKDECKRTHVDVGILRPNWLEGANYLGTKYVDGFLCNGWEKVDFIWYYEDTVTNRPVYWRFFTGFMLSPVVLKNLEDIINISTEKLRNKEMAESKAKNLTTEMEVRNGDAREVLCNAAKEYNPDMLVIGGNGHGVLKRRVQD